MELTLSSQDNELQTKAVQIVLSKLFSIYNCMVYVKLSCMYSNDVTTGYNKGSQVHWLPCGPEHGCEVKCHNHRKKIFGVISCLCKKQIFITLLQ